LTSRARRTRPLCRDDLRKRGIDRSQKGLPDGEPCTARIKRIWKFQMSPQAVPDQLAQPLLRMDTGLEHLEVSRRLRPPPIGDRRREYDRGKLPACAFDRRQFGAMASDGDRGKFAFGAIDAHRNAFIHQESNVGGIRCQPCFDDPRERLYDVDVESGKVQEDLLCVDFPRKRGEIDIDGSYRTPELIDVREAKCLWRQNRRAPPLNCILRN
jgi:hypothetical protein